MSERLSVQDIALLSGERANTPKHNATLEVFDPGVLDFGAPALTFEALLGLVADRIAFVPRYRQRLRAVPGGLAAPVWGDDEDFDLEYHVRRSALPRPGSMSQLRELTARIMSRRLDRTRPLWELYFVEGLEDGRVALLSKSHQVLVDGASTVDLGQVLLDVDVVPREVITEDWRPEAGPSPSGLVAEAVVESLRHPTSAVRNVLGGVDGVVRAVGGAGERVLSLAGALTVRSVTRDLPFSTTLSEQRRFVTVATHLEDYRRIRAAHGGTVNDAILATVAGAMRAWLLTRAESVSSGRLVRAMVPMSVIDADLEPTSLGSVVTGHLLDLPIGEPSPAVRLHQVSYALKAHGETGRAVAADRLAGVAGFAPATFHALGSRVAAAQMRRGFHLVVTNVPGPQFPLYAARAQMLESYPVQPLLDGQALAMGVTSYNGGVFFGITADFDAVPDLEVLAQCLTESLEELVDSASEGRQRAPRGRKRSDERRS